MESSRNRSMSSTIFIAVQCFQCSTMQVKQQKKSSNKWNCVICNEKQSLRKVFARGFQSKDVRKFVQGFNMARQIADEAVEEETLISTPEQIAHDDYQNTSGSKRRSDWTEYLDPEEQRGGELEEEGKGGDSEPEIVTELPKEMFKKPKLKNYSAGTNNYGGKKLYSPTFAKRKPNNKPRNSQVKNYADGLNRPEEKKLYSPTFAKRNSNNKTSNPQEHKEAGKSQPTMGQGPSKWSDYLALDEDYLSFGATEDLSDAQSQWNEGMLETSFNCQSQRVEDEVHPDFN